MPFFPSYQFTARVLEDIKISENTAMPEGSLQPQPDVPIVLIDAEHTLKSLQAEEIASAMPRIDEESQLGKTKLDNEMDPADISNVSPSTLSFSASGTCLSGWTQRWPGCDAG